MAELGRILVDPREKRNLARLFVHDVLECDRIAVTFWRDEASIRASLRVREVLGLLYILHNRRLLGMLDSFRRNAPQRR